MATTSETQETAFPQPQPATVIAHDPRWREPVIPVVAGITGWNIADFGGFTKWHARPGEVVLGVWNDDYWRDWDGHRTEEQIAAEDAPMFEVALPLDEHRALLLGLLASDGGTLAVLEFGGGEDHPPVWGWREVSADGLAGAIREAGRGR